MFILGLTGSIGMGKSTTAKFFAEAGIPVHDADAVVHRLYDGEAAAKIAEEFPGTVTLGKVDRERLGARVLGKPEAIKRLEDIVHPLVRAAERAFLEKAERDGAPVVVLDIPLLFETKGDERCDAVAVVSAPADVQRQRAFERRGMSDDKLAAILQKQMPDEEKRRRADFVVDTSRGLDAARDQVRDILKAIGKMPKRRR
jgi:dephospho-CoA kinase